ncbi:glycosyltransferase family 4 protein [Sporosarcina sp. OR05]|uniref:glycosyltransferase family 4 protein n=1 Tax=Sporosarcina sp. OR05 TaxID=2969819 RepID=UPI00352AA710
MSKANQTLQVVQVITKMDTVGGAQIHVRDVAKQLQTNGHAVHLITGGKKHVHECLKSIPIHFIPHLVRELHPLSDIKAFFEMKRLLKIIQPDLVATHSSKAGIIGRLAARSLHIPVIFTAHGWSFTEGVPHPRKLFYRLIETIVGYFTSGVIAVSNYDYQLALQHHVVSQKKIICIQNGVHDFKEPPQRLKQGREEIRLIMIARFAPPKMQQHLLEVLIDLKHLPWVMQFVGDGPTKESVERFAIDHGIGDKVHFEGWREDIEELLANADVCMLISEFEGLPLSILEAMRASLPIIATDVGGVKEAVTAQNGFLVSKDDKNALKIAIHRLVEDQELRFNMGENGRKLYEERFTFDHMMEDTFTYYKTIAGKEDET